MKTINDLFRQLIENNSKIEELENQLKRFNHEFEAIKSSILKIFFETPEWFRFLKKHTVCIDFPRKEDIHDLNIEYYQYKVYFSFEDNKTGYFFCTEKLTIIEIIKFLTDSNYFADELAKEEEEKAKEELQREQDEEEKERAEYERLKAKFEPMS